MADTEVTNTRTGLTRRELLKLGLSSAILASMGFVVVRKYTAEPWIENTFIIKVTSYEADIRTPILVGLKELGIMPQEIEGKKILLKPNLVELNSGSSHIVTHPMVVRGAVEAFLSLGAAGVQVAEGPGHVRDTLMIVEESGLAEVLWEDRIPFVDLNCDDGFTVANAGGYSRLKSLTLPVTLKQADFIVSLAKLKTHHWAGVTLSMKNLFGIMPGIYYGWPKNVLHTVGIDKAILDINATLPPHLAIIDGIVGMEGDGPIMGTPKYAGVLIMGRNLPAVDATSARIMGINPDKIRYLAKADGHLGPIQEDHIVQRGEPIASVRTDFQLLEHIPAHRGIRL